MILKEARRASGALDVDDDDRGKLAGGNWKTNEMCHFTPAFTLAVTCGKLTSCRHKLSEFSDCVSCVVGKWGELLSAKAGKICEYQKAFVKI